MELRKSTAGPIAGSVAPDGQKSGIRAGRYPARVPAFVQNLYRDVVLNGIIGAKLVPRGLRWRALRVAGLDVQRSSINANVFFGWTRVTIGRAVLINSEVFVDAAARVTIGDRVSIGPRAVILTGTHEIGTEDRRAGRDVAAPVTIGAGAWIGAHATILPGVTVGRGAVVAAGALVTEDCVPNGLYVGVPARLVRIVD